MAKSVENLSLNMVGLLAEDEKQYYVDEHIYIAMNAQDFGLKDLPTSTHFFVVVCIFVLAVAIAYASLKLYDEPAREWLKRKLF